MLPFTLLTSGATRGKFHVITARGVQHDHKWKSTSLFPHSVLPESLNLCKRGFISAKAGFPSYLPCLEPGMSKDCSLCPVQALKVCLAKSGDKDLLFISNKMASKETFTQIALCLAQETDPLCISHSSGGAAALLDARTHEVCSLAASLAFKGSVDTEVILSACLGTPLHLL